MMQTRIRTSKVISGELVNRSVDSRETIQRLILEAISSLSNSTIDALADMIEDAETLAVTITLDIE
jgi:hypothetical protein